MLFQVLEKGRSGRDSLEQVQQRHNPRDNAWIQEMTFGVLRQLPLLQSWLRTLLTSPLKGDKKIIEHLLLLGLYQQAFSRVAGHAAVSETVNAAASLGAPRLKGLVNAVLRNFSRQALAEQPVRDPIIQSGLPKWLYQAIDAAYGDSSQQVIEQTNQPAPLWLRINTRQVSKAAFTDRLDEAGITYTSPGSHPEAIILNKRQDVTALPGFEQGWFAVQDGAAQLAAHYLDAQPGERVLDCCAAPGGKTGHIVERTPDLASCVALDSDASRIKRTTENMQRLQHSQAVSLACADAALPADWWDGEPFDRILLDAPCSATGVIRRHPDIRWLRKASDIEQLMTIQAKLLDALWPLLRPGGTLLYATCSVLPRENQHQIRAFLDTHTDASLEPVSSGESRAQPGRQILPGEQQMDGFYYARLVKSANNQ
ncbi:ribosomal RNA small subunit methyltransferase B [Alteromonas halophila]|uniref:16S rRNA (cytosine(967)-C(5))-methyltransferase n=1 Tax=Alteromonas halophila TaxID=516698 RepID=A0A918N055_9ALTE|nr:ribosomal RNA small subunit methyltransferase B [Alteromonas halophila]